MVENLVHRVTASARDLPARDALVFARHENSERIVARPSYRALGLKARRVIRWLTASHSPGEHAVLMFPSGADLVAALSGCRHAGPVAVPAPARFRPATTGALPATGRAAE